MHHYGALNYFLLLDGAGFALGIIVQYNKFHNGLFSILHICVKRKIYSSSILILNLKIMN